MTSAKSADAIEYGVSYGTIVCVGSLGAFLEGNWSKVHQSYGNMRLPMIAQITGAVFSLMLPVFFQAIVSGLKSLFLSLLRQIFCLIPIFWAFSLIGLNYTWLAFPCSEAISGGVSLISRVVNPPVVVLVYFYKHKLVLNVQVL